MFVKSRNELLNEEWHWWPKSPKVDHRNVKDEAIMKPDANRTEGSEKVIQEQGEVEVDSVTLNRLLAEVRNEEALEPAAYNRTHNRHNRTR